ncbi:ISL3 family transposase [Salipaludibacillus sp. CF4.18]|uniref:ISL3 family transposase n=1 Tax=Salipaludibacillus sp. CF4.18 TaxID=3373081 RepID=UPI003EE80FC7
MERDFKRRSFDVENREIIDILPNRRVETIEKYFRGCDYGSVEIVVMDLSKAFKEAIRRALGDVLIIADRFHYMRQVYWAFDEVRRQVQHDLWKEKRIRMKRSKELLWKSPEKLNDKGKRRVKEVLEGHDELRKAYELKNALDHWFKNSNSETAKAGLQAWISLVKDAEIPAFQKSQRPLPDGNKKTFSLLYIPLIIVTSKALVMRQRWPQCWVPRRKTL